MNFGLTQFAPQMQNNEKQLYSALSYIAPPINPSIVGMMADIQIPAYDMSRFEDTTASETPPAKLAVAVAANQNQSVVQQSTMQIPDLSNFELDNSIF